MPSERPEFPMLRDGPRCAGVEKPESDFRETAGRFDLAFP